MSVLPLLRRLAIAALVAPLLACGDDGGLDPIVQQAAEAEARWQAQGLSHYTVEARIICFCPQVMSQWHELTVASDSVIAIKRVEENTDVVPGDVAERVWFSSVESVFARMRTWPSAMSGNRLSATFDPQTGMPLTVNFTTGPHIADGGATHQFRMLKPGLTSN